MKLLSTEQHTHQICEYKLKPCIIASCQKVQGFCLTSQFLGIKKLQL